MAVVDLFKMQAFPFRQIAVADGVERVQLGDVGLAGDRECQRLGTLQFGLQLAVEQTAAQFQVHEGAEVGLGDAQVDIAGADGERAAGRAELQLAFGLQRALAADAALQGELEGRGAEAVEIAQGQVERPYVQRDILLGYAVGEVDAVIAQFGVAHQDLPWAAGSGIVGAVGSGRFGSGFRQRLRCGGA